MMFSKTFIALLVLLDTADASCPYLRDGTAMTNNPHNDVGKEHRKLVDAGEEGDYGVPEGGFAAVRQDIRELLTDSQDFFPGDFEPPIGPHYGGLFIRLAWHCSGSYRDSDGRGGCDGGRIRFDPELNWMDNGNLNNALRLLEPIKEKYGSKLSWGDLIVLAGTEAIAAMGGPVLGFCGGRVDDGDGSESLILGPSDIQEELVPCQTVGLQGACPSPLGPTTVGLIYVNPAGPVNKTGDAVASGVDIRGAFARMGFNDTESVALIGGGHAFGKCHGACENPPCGEAPMVGIGPNTYTSGFEGAWTTQPTNWTNQYFHNLFDYQWELGTGAGGLPQWAPTDTDKNIIMLTTDVALSVDPIYEPISRDFAENITALEHQFAHAWYRLTTSDMGPRERCINENPKNIPGPQWWQHPLPKSEEAVKAEEYVAARTMIDAMLEQDSHTVAAFANLAYHCASTFRATDFRGGCNGARVRFSPESEWPENAGTADALSTLETVKTAHPSISYSDLIVLAGHAAVEKSLTDQKMPFCAGRVDAQDGAGSETLAPRYYTPPVVSIRDDMQVKGLTPREGVALFAIPSSAAMQDSDSATSTARNSPGSTTLDMISNEYFVRLLAGNGNFSIYELALLEDEFRPIVEEYAATDSGSSKFNEAFVAAWTKMMTADRFDGPVDNACTGVKTPTTQEELDAIKSSASSLGMTLVGAVTMASFMLALLM